MGLVSATKNKPTTDKLALYHDHSASFTASTLSLLLHHISRAGISRADISRADALDPLADALSPLSLSLAPLTAHISDLFHDAPSRFPLPSLSLSLAALSQLAPDSPLIPHMAALVNDNSGKIMIVRPFPHLALSQLSTFFAAHPQINSAPFFASIEAASSIVTAHCPAASLLPVETAFAALSHPSPTFTPSLATKRANMSLNSRAKTLPTHEALSLFFDHPFSLSSPPDIYNLIHLNYLLSETSSNPRRPSLTALTLKTTNQILYSPLPPLSALSKLLRSLRSLPDLPPSDRGTCALADVSSALDQHAETIFNTGKSSDMTALVHFIATNPPSDPPRNALPPLLSRHLSFLTEYASVHEISTILRAQATLPYSKAHDLYPPLSASLATWCPRASPSEMTHLVTTLCASPASCWRIVAYLDSEAPWYCASEDFRLVCKAARSLAERGYCTPALIAACVKKIKAKQRNARSSETRGSMMTLEEMRDLATAAALGPPGTNQTNVVKAISPDLISRLRAASRHSYFSRHACDLIWALAVIDPRHPVIPDLYGEILADPAARGHALLDDQRIRKLNEVSRARSIV